MQPGYDCEVCGKKVNSRSDLNNHPAWWDTLETWRSGQMYPLPFLMNKNQTNTIIQHRMIQDNLCNPAMIVRCVAKKLIVEVI